MILASGVIYHPAPVNPLASRRRQARRRSSMCATCLRYATINGAKHLRLDGKTGSLKPGKEADIIILDATHLNVFPVNHVPGAVVQMMDRSNVETVIVAGKVRKWKGRLLDVDLNQPAQPARGFARLHLPGGGCPAEPVPLMPDARVIAGRLRPPR